jgi:GTP-binding protein HflX
LLAREDRDAVEIRTGREPDIVSVSALDGTGCFTLLTMIDERLSRSDSLAEVEVALSDGATLAWLYEKGDVLKRTDNGMRSQLTVRLAPRDMARFRKRQAAGGNIK